MGNTINDVGSWLNGKVWRPVEKGLFNYQGSVDKYVGQVVNWNPAEITTSDRAAAVLTLFAAASPFACEQQKESSKPAEEDISQPKDVAAEVGQKPVEDINQSKDITPEVKDFSKEKGWVFCAAKTGAVTSDEDCNLDKNIQDEISNCVSLYDILLEDPLFGDKFHLNELYYDHDKLVDFLLNNGSEATFCFKGDNKWPTSATQCLQMAPVPSNCCWGHFWGGGESTAYGYEVYMTVHTDPDKSISLDFLLPDHCQTHYHAPCADESVCE